MSERTKVWICGACARTAETRMAVGDESCYLNAVQCFSDTIVRNAEGRIVAAKPVGDEAPWTEEERKDIEKRLKGVFT